MTAYKNSKGITLIEIIVVIAIIGILYAVIIPGTITFINRARNAAARQEVSGISNLVFLEWKIDNNENISDKDFYLHLLTQEVMLENTFIMPKWNGEKYTYENGFYYLASNEKHIEVIITGFVTRIDIIDDFDEIFKNETLGALTELPSAQGVGTLIGDYQRNWNTRLKSERLQLGWRPLEATTLFNALSTPEEVKQALIDNKDILGIDAWDDYLELSLARQTSIMQFMLDYREALNPGFGQENSIINAFNVGLQYQLAIVDFIEATSLQETFTQASVTALLNAYSEIGESLLITEEDSFTINRLLYEWIESDASLRLDLRVPLHEQMQALAEEWTAESIGHLHEEGTILSIQLGSIAGWEDYVTLFSHGERLVYDYLNQIDAMEYAYGDVYEKIFSDMFAMQDNFAEMALEDFNAFFELIIAFRKTTDTARIYANELQGAEAKAELIDRIFDNVLNATLFENSAYETHHIWYGGSIKTVGDLSSELMALRGKVDLLTQFEIDPLIDSIIANPSFSFYAELIEFLKIAVPEG